MTGRPTKRTPEAEAKIIELLKAGNTRKTACIAAGISEDTFARWRKDDEDFADAIEKAEEEAVARNVAIIQRAAITTWQAAAWWLERRRRSDYALKQEVENSGELIVKVKYADQTTPDDNN